MLDIIIQNLSSIIAILASFVTIYIYFKERTKKYLDYKIVNNSSLLEVGEEIKKDVKILYKDNPIEKVNLLEIEIKNNGNESINKEDFKKPIQLAFGKEAQILTWNVINKIPSNMTVKFVLSEDYNIFDLEDSNYDKILFVPELMNPRDKFTMKLLVSKMENIYIDSRVEGIKRMRNEQDLEVSYGDIIFPFVLFFAGIFIIYIALNTGELNIYNIFLAASFLFAGFYFLINIATSEIKKLILRFT